MLRAIAVIDNNRIYILQRPMLDGLRFLSSHLFAGKTEWNESPSAHLFLSLFHLFASASIQNHFGISFKWGQRELIQYSRI